MNHFNIYVINLDNQPNRLDHYDSKIKINLNHNKYLFFKYFEKKIILLFIA